MPSPAITRNDQKTMGEYGRSAFGNSLSPRISPSQECVRMTLPRCGTCTA